MTGLDHRLHLLRGQAREWAAELRPHSLEVDRDPDAVLRLLHLPSLSWPVMLHTPREFEPDPLVIAGERFGPMNTLEMTVFMEEQAWGDLGIALAAPGAAMAGIVVRALGDHAQQERFFGRLLSGPTWAFFALTEEQAGSDAVHMRTTLAYGADGAMVLNGNKRYVGNAARAASGVVFARTGSGTFGLGAVLVESRVPGFSAVPLDTIGVRAAQLGAITLDRAEVDQDAVLGAHLPRSRRGMWAWLKTFNQLRPVVATMGVGVARAAHEYVRAHRSTLSGHEQYLLDRMGRRIESVRRLVRSAAIAVDGDSSDGHLASAAKLSAARLAEDVTLEALRFFGPGARIDHPLLEKLSRDARAVEYMEGTRNIQRLGVFSGLVKGRIGPAAARGRDGGADRIPGADLMAGGDRIPGADRVPGDDRTPEGDRIRGGETA